MKLRRLVMVSVLCSGSFAAAAMTADAQLERGLLDVGRNMLDLPEQWLSAPSRTIVLNGTRVNIVTGRSDLSMSALLDHAQTRCREHGGGLAQLVQASLPKHRVAAFDGVLRAENSEEGVVACLQLGAKPLTTQQLIERLERFSDKLDFHELGGIRMIRVTPRAHGSFFVVASSEGSASLLAMFPERGDAPGIDFPDLPRPRAATRLLSAWQVDGDPAVNSYRVARAVGDVWSEQLAQLEARGWQATDAHSARSAERVASLFWRNGKTAVVIAQADGIETLLSILPLDSGPGAVMVSKKF